ncbi:MAG: hypothetical protein HY852_19045 [Bradyrhizobium sp.]|uniref:hypothetical protein n=1 Tax=Bradyrhizobium sp. TaxID=376 RepID=UPI0025BF6548|nr:hypothetical protein [Bradyrhizobium sp.]MBI5263909.1 hypothetical protein [Bradyrhizobium sp.]
MSESGNAPSPLPPAQGRSGWLTVLMVIVGIVLLLPGSCALVIVLTSFSEVRRYFDSDMVVLILILVVLGAGGAFLIRAAIRGRRRT